MFRHVAWIALDHFLGATQERSNWPLRLALTGFALVLVWAGGIFLIVAGYMALAHALGPPAAAAICGGSLLLVALMLLGAVQMLARRRRAAITAAAVGTLAKRESNAAMAEFAALLASGSPTIVLAAIVGLGIGLALRMATRRDGRAAKRS